MSRSSDTEQPRVTCPTDTVAVIVARDGRLPVGADEAVAEADGWALVVGSGAEQGASMLLGARQLWWSDTGPGLRPAALASRLAPWLAPTALVVIPASPDGRDLAPRVAALLDRPLVARAVSAASCRYDEGSASHPSIHALVARMDDRVMLPVDVDGPAVVTLAPSGRTVPALGTPAAIENIELSPSPSDAAACHLDPETLAVLEPDLHTMDLADATRVVAGGAGLAAGTDDRRAAEVFDQLVAVAAALGGSAGATRVATDAGWTGHERQIGTTGVTIDPELYIAFGISGATQHVGGLGSPRHIVSVNTDSSSPMTAMADLGLVTDAEALLVELANRFGVDGSGPPIDRGVEDRGE